MNPWDVVTWFSAVVLAASAALIFAFFLRDARSIFDREMHDHEEGPERPSTSGTAAGEAGTDPPEDLPR
jgi:hypothetical protein